MTLTFISCTLLSSVHRSPKIRTHCCKTLLQQRGSGCSTTVSLLTFTKFTYDASINLLIFFMLCTSVIFSKRFSSFHWTTIFILRIIRVPYKLNRSFQWCKIEKRLKSSRLTCGINNRLFISALKLQSLVFGCYLVFLKHVRSFSCDAWLTKKTSTWLATYCAVVITWHTHVDSKRWFGVFPCSRCHL